MEYVEEDILTRLSKESRSLNQGEKVGRKSQPLMKDIAIVIVIVISQSAIFYP
jgi:hypothetical protein